MALRQRHNWKTTAIWDTAIHEAGHLVIACVLGIKVYKATLVRTPSLNSAGFIETERRNDPTYEFIEAEIAMCLAGMEAERVFLKGAKNTYSSGDTKRILRLIIHSYCFEGFYERLDQGGKNQFILHQLSRRRKLVAKLMRSREMKDYTYQVAQLLVLKKVLNRSQTALLSRRIRPRSAYSIRTKVTSMWL